MSSPRELTPEEEILHNQIDQDRLPRHVAVIMDGNGRWAGIRGLPRVEGHRAGIVSVRESVEAAARLELDCLTLYAFSVENWKRPKTEVRMLMKLLREYLHKELPGLKKNNIRFRVSGRIKNLPGSVQRDLQWGMDETADNTGLLFNVALNYGGRTEIIDACRRIVQDCLNGGLKPREIDETEFARRLYTAGLPDPDLLIRTSGEMRVSNFLLWQIAYAEIWFTEILWPDFRTSDFFRAILDFQKRERRFGGVRSKRGALLAP